MTFRKLTAAGAGKLIVAYLREQQVEPERDVRTQADKARDVETGERLNSYYTGREGRGAWAPHLGPRIADQLGIDIMKPPTDEGLARLFECKRADNGEGWSNHGRKRELCGFDFTAAPAKSVTLAAEFAPTREEQALLWQAIHQANDTAMAFVAKEVGVARRGSGDTSYIEEGDLEREGRVIVSRSLAIEKAKITVPLLISALFYDLAPDRTVTIPTQSERRERDLQELFRRAKKPVALFVDDAHDLHPKTLVALKRLTEVVAEGGGQLSVVLVGHPRLRNDLRRPQMEEIGDRATVFEFGGLRDRQRDYTSTGCCAIVWRRVWN
ncbi:relaxase domain-containing protein [Acidomonas methanolica]|nr:relaxase domain-containing protein [Acidomonas methanolica]